MKSRCVQRAIAGSSKVFVQIELRPRVFRSGFRAPAVPFQMAEIAVPYKSVGRSTEISLDALGTARIPVP
jgi:hypothetical protein